MNVDQEKIKGIIERRLLGASAEFSESFPDVLKHEVRWICFSNEQLLMLMFLDEPESARIQDFDSKGYNLFPGLFTTEQTGGAMMGMSNSRNGVVSGCTSSGMNSFAIGPDCTFIVQNHTQILKTNELGEIKYTVPLAYFISFGEEITENSAYKSLEELVVYSIKSWGEAS